MVFDGFDDGDGKLQNGGGGGGKAGVPQESNKESQITGTVGFAVYRSYFRAVESAILVTTVGVLFLLAQGTMSGIDYFISQW